MTTSAFARLCAAATWVACVASCELDAEETWTNRGNSPSRAATANADPRLIPAEAIVASTAPRFVEPGRPEDVPQPLAPASEALAANNPARAVPGLGGGQ